MNQGASVLAGFSGCLVTGGAGFVGSHLVDALIARGWKVIVLDDFSTGGRVNLNAHRGGRCLKIVEGDVRDRRAVAKALTGVSVVFHLAALAWHGLAVDRPVLVNDVNVGGTANLLEQATRKGVRRFVFASSAAVYGEPERLPIREDARIRRSTPYGASKLAGEKYCHAFQSTYGVETVCLRYFNIYGPRQSAGSQGAVVPEFLDRIRLRKPFVIHGNGRQVRDFIYVSDAVEATILAGEVKRASGEILNIATGTATSILSLANQLMKLAGDLKLGRTFEKRRHGDIFRSCADTTKAKAVLGFQAKTQLEDGLRTLMRNVSSREAS